MDIYKNESGWPVTPHDDIDKFTHIVMKKEHNCAVFIDECSVTIGKYPDAEVLSLATMSRHRGHVMHFVCQRTAQVSPTVVEQCPMGYIFFGSAKEGRLMSEHYAQYNLRYLIPNLYTYEYYRVCCVNVKGQEKLKKYRIIPQKG